MGLMTADQVAEVIHALETKRKNDPASTTPTAQTTHGPFPGNSAQYGIFARPGVRPEMFSALVRPPSFVKALGINESRFTNEKLEVMTGVLASTGTNATGFCGNPPTVGNGKVCKQNFIWGSYFVKTDLNVLPEIGQFKDRADVPRDILNAPLENRDPFIPDMMYRLDNGNKQLQYELFKVGVSIQRSLSPVLITGDTTQASNATEHGFIQEFAGLDGQIKTGYTDYDTNILCPAMDSAVVNFNADVAGTIGGGDGRNLVVAASELMWALDDRATEMGMEGVEWAIVTRKEAFRRMVEQWACDFATYRCASSSAGLPYNREVNDTNALRLEMINGQYLKFDNKDVPVLFSEGIPREGLAANTFMSDTYFVPLSWQGIPLTRLEYYPMNIQDIQEFASFSGAVGANYAVMNNGMWIVARRDNGFCVEWLFGAKNRLILETPFLAGRLDNVQYTFRAPIRNSDPTDTYFYADGGLTFTS